MPAPTLPTTKAPNNWLSTYAKGATLTGDSTKYNQLSANAGDVTLVGGANGNNTFIVYDPTDKIVQAASANVNTVETWGSGFALPANVQNITLEGTANAYAIGNASNNLMIGNSGNDTFTTGGGNDVIVDGTGSDLLHITKQTSSVTWVEDFKTSGTKLDKLDLSAYFGSFAAVQKAETQVGSDLQIDLGNGQTVMLQNIQASALTAATVATGVDISTMHMTFDEEFNSISLSATTPTLTTSQNTWNTTYSGGVRTLSANKELEYYVDPSYDKLGLNPFSDSNGVLSITASATPTADLAKVGNLPYVSGVLTTQNHFDQEYGYFEAGIEVPGGGQGLWPAFWMLPYNEWPPELDIMEQVNDKAGEATTSTYSTSISSTAAGHQSTSATLPVDLSAGFHTYAMNWTADTITFYVDGQQISQVATPADMHQKMYILLDLAVGGGWAGAPDSTTNWSDASMKVDYVRAYSSDPSIPAVGGTTTTGTTSTGTTSTGTTTTGSTGTTGTTSTGTTTTTTPPPNSTVVTVAASAKLSNAAVATDMTASFAPAVTAASTSTTYTAAQLGVTGAPAGTTVTVAYDKYDNITVTNNGAWGAIKNVTLNDAHATGMTINNFEDTEITTAGAGAAYVNINGVARGNIKLGDGANVVNIQGSANASATDVLNMNAGLGGSTVNYTGTTVDKISFRTGNGNSTIAINGQASGTVIVGSGNNEIFNNTTGALLESLGSGNNVMDFLAGAHATVANFNTAKDSIVLHGVTASQVKVTASGGSTDIAIAGGGTIHVASVNLTQHMSQISYA